MKEMYKLKGKPESEVECSKRNGGLKRHVEHIEYKLNNGHFDYEFDESDRANSCTITVN